MRVSERERERREEFYRKSPENLILVCMNNLGLVDLTSYKGNKSIQRKIDRKREMARMCEYNVSMYNVNISPNACVS